MNRQDLDRLREQEHVEHMRHEHETELAAGAECSGLLTAEDKLNDGLRKRLTLSNNSCTRAWYRWRLARSEARVAHLHLRSG